MGLSNRSWWLPLEKSARLPEMARYRFGFGSCNLSRPTTDADWNSEGMVFVSPTFVGNKPQFGQPNMA